MSQPRQWKWPHIQHEVRGHVGHQLLVPTFVQVRAVFEHIGEGRCSLAWRACGGSPGCAWALIQAEDKRKKFGGARCHLRASPLPRQAGARPVPGADPSCLRLACGLPDTSVTIYRAIPRQVSG